MRIALCVLFLALIAALAICHALALRSYKAIGRSVALLLGALIVPQAGNLIIVLSRSQLWSGVGTYICLMGMDVVMYALMWFTFDCCGVSAARRRYGSIACGLLLIDFVQLSMNPVLRHAFTTESAMVDGAPYYRVVSLAGMHLHRLVILGILLAVIALFLYKIVHSPRIDTERYSIILGVMILAMLWENAYIILHIPTDCAMLGYGVFGLMVFYLSLYYRPMRLLDSMLAHMASELPEALFFFDSDGVCIWANRPGIELTHIEAGRFEGAAGRIKELFGNYDREHPEQHELNIDGVQRYFILEEHAVTDDRNKPLGSFLRVRDNTIEHRTLQKEIYRATHDSLTDLYNRAGYELFMSNVELKTSYLLLVDADAFKEINDTYGHEVGDRILKKIAEILKRSFRSNDYVCRIGGDEFVVLMTRAGLQQRPLIVTRVGQINDALQHSEDGLPPVSVSIGIAHGRNVVSPEELFDHADKALYLTKNQGKCGYSFYED